MIAAEIARAVQDSLHTIVTQTIIANRIAHKQRENERTKGNTMRRSINTIPRIPGTLKIRQIPSIQSTVRVTETQLRTFSACKTPEFNVEGNAVATIKRIREMKLEQEFLNLEQGDMSMREYTTRFNERARFSKHHVQTEERRIHRYKWGMNFGTRELVKATRPKTYQEAVDAGAEMEKEKFRQNVFTNSYKRK
nr:hypothetical protein [Tanacetum cinerariifolium]